MVERFVSRRAIPYGTVWYFQYGSISTRDSLGDLVTGGIRNPNKQKVYLVVSFFQQEEVRQEKIRLLSSRSMTVRAYDE